MSDEKRELMLPKNLMEVGDKLTITMKYVVPSLNAMFAMNHWQRAKARKLTAAAFASALSQNAIDFSTPTMLVPKPLWTASDMLESLNRTIQARLNTASLKRRLRKDSKKPSSP